MTANRFNPFGYPSDAADAPVGEVPPMDQYDVIHKAIEKVGVDIHAQHRDVINAARAWRACTTVEAQDVAAQILADAVDRLPIQLAPASLIENRAAEVRRLEEFWADVEVIEKRIEDAPGLTVTDLARGLLSDGGAK